MCIFIDSMVSCVDTSPRPVPITLAG